MLVFVAHASFEWGSLGTTPLWSVAGLFAVLAVPAAHGLVRPNHPSVVVGRAALAPATAILVGELTGDPSGNLWWWFLGFAFVYPLALPRRFAMVTLAVVPVAYVAAALVGVTGSEVGRASLRGGILLALALVGLAAGRALETVVGETEDAEGQLQRRLAVFRAAFENAASGAALLDLNGNFVRVNQAMEDFLGRSRDELLTLGWGNVVHPEDLRRHSVRIRRLLEGELWSFHADGRFAMPDQRVRWGTAGMSLIADDTGRPRFVLVHVVNVTDARQGELELRRSEARSRGLFEVTPVPLLQADLTVFEGVVEGWRRAGATDLDVYLSDHPGALDDAVGAISYVGINHAARRLLGVEDIDELARAIAAGRLGTGYRAAVLAIARARWAGSGHLEVGAVLTDTTGAVREGTLRMVVPALRGEPALDSAVLAFTDPVSVRPSMRDRTAGDDRLLAAITGAPVVLFAVDADGIFTLSEGQGLGALGLEPGEAVGRSVFDIYADHPSVIANMRRALRGEEFTARVEVGDLVFEARYSPIVEHGELKGVIGLATDVTERERANERLRDLVRSKDELVATVSHELRTPLTAVIGFAHELRDGLGRFSPEEVQSLVALIGDQAVEVSDLVEDLLVASRVEWGDFVVVHEAVDLWCEVEAVLGARRVDSEVAADRTAEEAKVLADPTRVRQIIRNLITNADRYGGPHIMIRAEKGPDTWSLSVIDDGEGVPEAYRERIFEPYFQAHRRQNRTESVGLGLTVSRQLAQIMDGDLSYRCEEGRSHFTLTLPAL